MAQIGVPIASILQLLNDIDSSELNPSSDVSHFSFKAVIPFFDR